VKFPDAVRQATGLEVPVPVALEPLLQKEKISTFIDSRYEELRDYLKAKA
jgi:threonine synthase